MANHLTAGQCSWQLPSAAATLSCRASCAGSTIVEVYSDRLQYQFNHRQLGRLQMVSARRWIGHWCKGPASR
jgi:hypothetical protein